MGSDWDERSTVLKQSFDPSDVPDGVFLLAVVEGPDTGKTFTLEPTRPSRTLVGGSPACEMRLADPSVSRRHAAIDFEGKRLRITDLQSKNGTFVDGVGCRDAYLVGGETVRLGGTAIRVDREAKKAAKLPILTRFGRMIGASTEMRRLYPLCDRLAASDIPIVIEGETGTGKEVLAESLHEASPRAAGPFVVFDCTAVPPSLLESELFGHERGAFTGAVAMRRGFFEQADGGTLLIDEIGDLDVHLQPKLLRVLERSEVRRVGGNRPLKVNVRLLAATRRDLDREVQAGRFRDDLFHRLAVTRIELPPLRERRGDVSVLARHLWTELGGDDSKLTSAILRRWEDYAWPGNVRELRNAVARQLAVGELLSPADETSEASLESTDLVERVLAMDLPLGSARQQLVEEFERRYIERVLGKHGGSVVRAAESAGIARRYFQLLKRERLGK